MVSDAVLKSEGMNILIEKLGKVEAERFISLMNRDPFDYTRWHMGLFEGMSVREISAAAMKEQEAT